MLCNRYKGSDIASVDPETGDLIRLFHPRVDRWSDHFQIIDFVFEPLSAAGRVTIQLLRLNAPERIQERRLR